MRVVVEHRRAAPSAPGIALVVLGGYGFRWSHHYLLPLLGVTLIVEVARRVRDEELATMPITSETPPIADTTWATYIATVTRRCAIGSVTSTA